MRRALIVSILATVLVAAGAVGLVRHVDGAGPASATAGVDPGVLTQLRGDDLASTVTGLQEHLRTQPKDARGWATLGVAYVELARLTGDASYYPKAADVLDRSIAVQAADNDLALAGRAALAAARHQFGLALRDSRAALSINPYQLQALLIRVDALTELGRYRAQLQALRQADRRQPGIPVFSRYSYAEELRGHLDRAQNLLRRALRVSTVRTDQAYLLTLLGDLQRRTGRLDAAGSSIAQALTAVPGYVPALASRARLLVARHELPRAVRAWKEVISRLALPEYLLELGELYQATGRPGLAQQQFRVLRATKRLLAANGVRVDLETALYEADHGSPSAALHAARSEWSRRHSVQVADALAWALHVNGRDRRAHRLSLFATRMNTPVALLWVHRGRIEASLGDDEAATADIRRGLALDPGLSPWQVDRARAVLTSTKGSR